MVPTCQYVLKKSMFYSYHSFEQEMSSWSHVTECLAWSVLPSPHSVFNHPDQSDSSSQSPPLEPQTFPSHATQTFCTDYSFTPLSSHFYIHLTICVHNFSHSCFSAISFICARTSAKYTHIWSDADPFTSVYTVDSYEAPKIMDWPEDG